MYPELKRFIPQDLIQEQIVVDDSMSPIVERIGKYLTKEQMWKYFSSTVYETAGKMGFPYFRVDTGLISCRDYLWIINYRKNLTDEQISEHYRESSILALKVILWVEVGFEGLQNLANHPASRNWTSDVGHSVNDEERARGIMSRGKQFYDSVMRDFVRFRKENGIKEDCFTEIGLEGYLNVWSE